MNARACSATPALLTALSTLGILGSPGTATADDPAPVEISDDGLEAVTIRRDESKGGSVVRSDVVPSARRLTGRTPCAARSEASRPGT